LKKIGPFIASPIVTVWAILLAILLNLGVGFYFDGHLPPALPDLFFTNLAILLLGLFFLISALVRLRTIKRIKRDLQLFHEDGSEPQLPPDRPGELEGLTEAIIHFMKAANRKAATLAAENLNYFATNKVLKYKANSFSAVLQELPDGILLLDESGAVTFVNRRFTALLGSPPELVGKRVHEFSEDDELTGFLAQYQGKTRLRRAERIEFPPRNSPTKQFTAEAYPLLPKDESHTPLSTLVVVRDSTAEALARKARGEFVSHVSHELKSPLNVLKMYSEMLLDQGADNEAFRVEALNTIYDEVDRLETLINNLLSISKIEMGSIGLKRQRIKPVEFLKDTFQTICRAGKTSDLTFNLDLPHEISPIAIDKDLFRVAVNNLLTNAIKYNTAGGSVDMSARETDEKITIAVRDTGLGISLEDQEHIFEKFFRSEDAQVRERSGHGVGLSLAKGIIELHHGRLLMTSTLGKGTTFTIELDKGEGLMRTGI